MTLTLAALEADGTLVHAIINDILGYVEFINDSSSGELFQLVAYSVSKDAVVSKRQNRGMVAFFYFLYIFISIFFIFYYPCFL